MDCALFGGPGDVVCGKNRCRSDWALVEDGEQRPDQGMCSVLADADADADVDVGAGAGAGASSVLADLGMSDLCNRFAYCCLWLDEAESFYIEGNCEVKPGHGQEALDV